MPLFKYVGQGPVRYGTKPLVPGDIVDASAKPGKNFVPVEPEKEQEAPQTLRRRPTQGAHPESSGAAPVPE